MSHFGRTGPPDISDTYSLLVLNITFRTTADDLFPYFDKYGKVVDIFIPRNRKTGDSRGFAFVRYKYADEAQKAVDRLDGKVVDGREITVQFAKYGPNAEKIHKGRIIESSPKPKSRYRSRSRSPQRRYRDDYKDRDYRRRSHSRSLDRYDRDRYRGKDKDYRRRSRSCSASPDYYRGGGRGRYDDERRSRSRSRGRSMDSASPARRSPSPRRSASPRRSPSPRGESPDMRSGGRSPTPLSVSPVDRPRRMINAGCMEIHEDVLSSLLVAVMLMLRSLDRLACSYQNVKVLVLMDDRDSDAGGSSIAGFKSMIVLAAVADAAHMRWNCDSLTVMCILNMNCKFKM
uniref:RRM domain-containing protein n=1 Tax=Fagus sylvatica TaxID=28930 RepID=A0A2N9IUQ5_FAGSY